MRTKQYFFEHLKPASRIYVLLTLACLARPALATVAGSAPAQIASHKVYGDVLAAGNTLMVPTDPNNEEVNNLLQQSSDAFISGFPCDGALEHAFLFWTGSTDLTTDDTADITLADGHFINDVMADQCYTVPSMGGFFYCRADVTSRLTGHQSACGFNGLYTVGDVQALEGDYNSSDPANGPCFAQGKYAAWSLVLVYSEPESITPRDIIIYDGFLQLDEDSYNPGCGMSNPTPGVTNFSLGGFQVGNPAYGKLMYFALEGDDQLGIPPQTNCSTCYDYMKFNGTKLYDDAMVPDNLFNGSTSLTGVDIDVIDIGQTGLDLIQPGQTTAGIEVGSGDGCVSYNNPVCPPDSEGGGESFFLGWMIVSLDTVAPLFSKDNTAIWFDRPYAGRGEDVWLTIRVQNDGNADANDVKVWNTLPAGLEYLPGTTYVDGVPQADIGGVSPLHTAGGISLGRIRWDANRDREIRFQAQVADDQPDGASLCSTATVDSQEIEPFVTDPTDPCLTVRAPDIADPVLSVEDLNGGFAEPGDVLRYRAMLTNNGGQTAFGLSFTLDLPSYVGGLNIVSRPPESEDSSLQTGGANGTGLVDIRNITLHGNLRDSVEIVFDVVIFTEAELLAAGVASQEIDGLQLVAQGLLAGSALDHDLPTNQVVVTLTYRPILTGTRKLGVDVNAGRTEPGDLLRYTIEVDNVGNRAATVDVSDDLPAGVTSCSIVSGPPTASCVAPPAGANGTGQVTALGFSVPPGGGQVSIVFEVNVAGDASDGLVIANSAAVQVQEKPDENRVVTAPAFTVFHRAQFLVAVKSVQDMNGGAYEPGDLLTFSLHFVNDGNLPATNVLVSDPVDANLLQVTPGQGGVYAGGQVTWSIATVDPGQNLDLTFTARIASPLADGTHISNQATLVANEIPGPVATNTIDIVISSAPNLSTTTKAVVTQDLDSDGRISPGDRVDYTIVVRNTGNSLATNVVVNDTLDSNLENVIVGQGGLISGGVISWNLGTLDLSPAGDVTLTFSALIASPLADGTQIANQALVTATEYAGAVPSDDPATPAVDDPTLIVVHSQALITATKSVSDQNGGDAMPGDSLVYLLTLRNSGNAPATDVVVSDTLPAELTNPLPGQGGQLTGNTLTWNAATTPALSRILPGSPVVLSFTADLVMPLTDGTSVCNQGIISGAGFPQTMTDDPNIPGSANPTCVTVHSYPLISESTKIAVDLDGDGHFNPGDRVGYQVVVRNSGTENVSNIDVSDQVDARLQNVTVGQGGSFAGGVVSWSAATTPALASLAPGQTVTLTFEADIVLPLANGTTISNQGLISSQEIPGPIGTDDPSTPAPNDPTLIVVESAPDLGESTKNVEDLTGDPGRVEPGDSLRYTIEVRNSGTDIAGSIVVNDAIDSHLENVVPGQGGIFDGTSITWDAAGTPALANLSPLDPPVTLTFTASVKVPTQNGTLISNQGFMRRQGDPGLVPTDDPRTVPVDDSTDVIVISASDLTAATKIAYDEGGNELAPAAQVAPGQKIDYRLVIRNDGNDVARNVVVRDPVDVSLMTVESVGQAGALMGGEVRWSYQTNPGLLATIDPGQQVSLDFSVRLAVPLDNGLAIDNQALISADDTASEIATDDPRTPALDDPVRLIIVSAPDLSSSVKTVEDINGGAWVPGDQVRYRILVRNTGDAAARNVTVSDPLDGSKLENVIPGQGGVLTGGVINWDATTTPALAAVGLSPQGDVELTFTATIVVPLDDGTLVANQAGLMPEGLPAVLSDDPSTADIDDATTFQVASAPDLNAMTKSVIDQNGGDPSPGDALIYTITVTNEGSMVARDVVVTDAIDTANLQNITPADGGIFGAGSITWNGASTPALTAVAPGDVMELHFNAGILPLTPGGTAIANQAFAVSQTIVNPVPSDDPATAAVDDPTLLVIVASPEFGGSAKTVQDVNAGSLLPGEDLAFSITVRNTGNTYATQVVITDPLDANLVNVRPGQGGRIEAGSIVWDASSLVALSRMDPGDEVQLSFIAAVADDVADGTVIRNRAGIDCVEFVSAQQTNEVQITVSMPVLDETQKSVVDINGAPFEPGDVVRYGINVPNSGSLAAGSVVISDNIAGLGLVEITPADGGVLSGDVIVWNVGDIAAGASVLVSFSGRIPEMTPGGTLISNQASVTATELTQEVLSDDPTTSAVDDATRFTVDAAPDLSATTKQVEDQNGGVVKPGDVLTYTLVVKNGGNTWASHVVVNDPVDTQHLEDLQPGQGGVLAGGGIRWDVVGMPALGRVGLSPDADVTLTFTARVKQDVADGTTIDNQAGLNCDEVPEAELSDDPATPALDDPTRVTVVSAPYFESSHKEVVDLNGGLVELGDELEYSVAIVNSGSMPSNGTLVRDSIPSHSSYVSGSTTMNGAPVPDDAGGQSPLVSGMPVNSARPGTPAGVVLVDDGTGAGDAVAVVTFRVKVEAGGQVCGATISNKAWIWCSQTDPLCTNLAEVTVGDCPNLNHTVKGWYLAEDHGTQGQVDPGDLVAFTINIENTGASKATNVAFSDRLPSGATYRAGSLSLEGMSLTDATDGDAGEFLQDVQTVRVQIGELNAGDTARIEFRVLVEHGPRLVNQGIAFADELPDEPTDNDGDETNGDNPTVVPVGEAQAVDLTGSRKSVEDLNGGAVLPGDELRYTIRLVNEGTSTATAIRLTDAIPQGTDYVAGSLELDGRALSDALDADQGDYSAPARSVTFQVAELDAEADALVSFRVRIGAQVELGTIIDNFARLAADGITAFDTNHVTLTVGGAPGTGGVRGYIFIDMGDRGDDFLRDEDEALGGYRVNLYSLRDGGGDPVATGESDENGRYYLVDVEPGSYLIEAFSSTGVQVAERRLEGGDEIRADLVSDLNLPIDPSGRVFDSTSGALIGGARVTVFYDTENSLSPGEKVPLENMPYPSQQDQLTDAHGFYAFDLQADNKYRIVVQPPSPAWVFPSQSIPAADGFAADLLTGGKVVDNDLPDPGGDTRYFMRFDLGEDVHNNHVPLDLLSSSMKLVKHVNKRVASVGDIVSYTLTLYNGSGQDLGSDWKTEGVWIKDMPAAGFAYIEGSARVDVTRVDGSLQTFGQNNTPTKSRSPGRRLDFGPYPLKASETLRVRYYMALGSDVSKGEHENRATAFIQGDLTASNQATASVRVIDDPVFDEALLIGKVFCDRNRNGRQDPGDDGVPGARVYIDTGWYAETDDFGKYHLKGIEPGLHLLKIDADTLPPGDEVIGTPAHALNLTRGIIAKLNFAVDCREMVVTASAKRQFEGPQATTAMIAGNLDDFSLAVQDRPVILPELRLWLGRPPEEGSEDIYSFELRGGVLEHPLSFGIQAPDEKAVSRWNLEIGGPDGKPVDTMSGDGSPGDSLGWDPGRRELAPGTYTVRLSVRLKDGTHVFSAPLAFGVGILKKDVAVQIFPARLVVSGDEMKMGEVADFQSRVPVAKGGTLEIDYTQANGRRIVTNVAVEAPPKRRRMTFSGNLAHDEILLDGKKIPVALRDLDVLLVEPTIFEVRGSRDRVSSWKLLITDAKQEPLHEIAGLGSPPARISFDGYKLPGGNVLEPGWYFYRLAAKSANGEDVKTPARLFEIKHSPQRYELPADEMFIGRSARPTHRLVTEVGKLSLMLAESSRVRLRVEAHSDNRGGAVRAQKRTEYWARSVRRLLEIAKTPPDSYSLEALGASRPKLPNLGRRNMRLNRRLIFVIAGAGSGEMPRLKPSVEFKLNGESIECDAAGKFEKTLKRLPGQVLKLVWDDPDGRRLGIPVKLPGPRAARTIQAQKPVALRVVLPPEGAEIRSESLLVKGTSDPGNRVEVNGKQAALDPRGNFSIRVPVSNDTREILVVATSADGRKSEVRSPVKVARNVWFLMAMADTAVAELEAGQHLDGVTKRTSTVIADKVMLHGRAVVYLKARIKGKYLFDNYKITAHFDTAKGDGDDFFRQLVDPDRYYPVYGDSAAEVQDVNARRKLYVLVEADESSLRVGNFRTRLEGIDVLRYDRTFYGGQLVLKKKLGRDFETEVKAHVTDGFEQVRHAHAELNPTGGSLYYLPHAFILEGSEQVFLTVRDAESGMILMRMPKQRDIDYTIRYREGRIMFKGPVASTLDAGGLQTSNDMTLTAEGNPVSIEVNYEYEGGHGAGEISWAVQAHQSWQDTIRIGGTYIREGRLGDDFVLWGTDLTLKDPKNQATYLKAEFARSAHTDADNFISSDGGLSFSSLGPKDPGNYGRPDSGDAWKIAAGIELAPYLDRRDPLLNLSGYFQWLQPGFFSNGMLTEQGQKKFGGRIVYHINRDAMLDLRHDGALSVFFTSGTERELNRQLSRLSYTQKLDRLQLGLSYLHAMSEDSSVGTGLRHSDAVGAGVDYRISKRWQALFRQDAIVNAGDLLVDSFGDRMKTSLGVKCKLTDDIDFNLTERVRWSGENATVLGFTTRLGEKAKVYTNERFQLTGSRYVSTTVLGAEDEPFKGVKTYGEYQLNGASSGTTNRAVLGLNNHFRWGKGWTADLHYERTQVFGDGGFGPGLQLPGGTGSAVLPDGVSSGTGFEGVSSLSLPGMNSYGSFLSGNSSRDAVGAGLELKGAKSLKLSLRIEFRYDDADNDMIVSSFSGLARSAVKDRLQFVALTGVSWKWTEDLSFAMHLNFADTEAIETSREGVVYVKGDNEARIVEGSVGMAFRPVRYDWLALLWKYTFLLEKRPLDLTGGQSGQSESHVFTIMPILELPALRLQLVEKFAWKYVREQMEGLPDASGHTILWINRLNFHVIAGLEIGAEYRLLRSFLAHDLKHGFLGEVAYVLMEKVRIAAGYNFTSFSDNEFDRNDYDHGGFFFRVTGQY